MNFSSVIVAIVIAFDDSVAREDVNRLVTESSRYTEQLGAQLELRAVSPGIHVPELPAKELLRALEGSQHGSHVSVLLTARYLYIPPWEYRGVASGSACHGAQIVLHVRNDGRDALALAHEIAHTLGATHDRSTGYVMDEYLGANGIEFSARTIKQTRYEIRCLASRAGS